MKPKRRKGGKLRALSRRLCSCMLMERPAHVRTVRCTTVGAGARPCTVLLDYLCFQNNCAVWVRFTFLNILWVLFTILNIF